MKRLFEYMPQDHACIGRVFSIAIFLAVIVNTAHATDADIDGAQDEAQVAVSAVSFDGLELIEDARVGAAYINPNADFSVFQRVSILDPYVSFRRNWLREKI